MFDNPILNLNMTFLFIFFNVGHIDFKSLWKHQESFRLAMDRVYPCFLLWVCPCEGFIDHFPEFGQRAEI